MSRRRPGYPSKSGAPQKYHKHTQEIPEYYIWEGIKARCYNPNNTQAYPRYGGRGIKVCKRWRESFQAFYDDMGPRPTTKHTIERIDNNGDYCPENCCWATMAEQAHNKTSNHLITYKGETHILADWGRITGIDATTIDCRLLRYDWPVGEALGYEPHQRNSGNKKYTTKLTYKGRTMSIYAWAKGTGISYDAIVHRIRRGWEITDILTVPMRKYKKHK